MIYIIIPVFNRWNYTKSCLDSLRNQTCNQFKIIVVDHGSKDNTSQEIKVNYPEVILLEGNEEMWWTAATNFGIHFALQQQDVRFILTLNNDTVATNNYIESLLLSSSYASNDAIIGSTAIDFDTGNVVYRGEVVYWYKETSKFFKDLKERPKNGLIPVSIYPGRGMLIPVKVFDYIGVFDEINFPHYMADYEFTLRAFKAKISIFCSWDAQLKIYPEASGANQLKKKRSISGYKEHLFGMRGGANLPLFYNYAFLHCPKLELPSYLLIGTLRRLLGYWL